MRMIKTEYRAKKLDGLHLLDMADFNLYCEFFDFKEERLEEFLIDNKLHITNEYPMYQKVDDNFYKKDIVEVYTRDGVFYGYLLFD